VVNRVIRVSQGPRASRVIQVKKVELVYKVRGVRLGPKENRVPRVLLDYRVILEYVGLLASKVCRVILVNRDFRVILGLKGNRVIQVFRDIKGCGVIPVKKV
jgi:hypothetical protein